MSIHSARPRKSWGPALCAATTLPGARIALVQGKASLHQTDCLQRLSGGGIFIELTAKIPVGN